MTSTLKLTFLPSWVMLQCSSSKDVGLLLMYFCRCSTPLVYVFYAVSLEQLPLPFVVQAKQSSRVRNLNHILERFLIDYYILHDFFCLQSSVPDHYVKTDPLGENMSFKSCHSFFKHDRENNN